MQELLNFKELLIFFFINHDNERNQAGAELCKAQIKFEVLIEVVVVVEVGVY